MALPRRIPGERTAVRLGARLRRAEVHGVGGELQRRIARRLAPAAAPGSLLQRIARWEGSAMLGWAGSQGWSGGARVRWSMSPGMVLPFPELPAQADDSGDFVAPAGRRVGLEQAGEMPRTGASREARAPHAHAALRRAEQRSERAHPAPTLRSLWAERSREVGGPLAPSRPAATRGAPARAVRRSVATPATD
ncbi:MAG: hypothetical protein ABIO70_00620, partial [Pseudomonadota bacterium]